MAEWLGKGLQNPLRRFNSGSDLKISTFARVVELDIHEGLKIPWEQSHASSSLAPGT
jgi:hypothetical protein